LREVIDLNETGRLFQSEGALYRNDLRPTALPFLEQRKRMLRMSKRVGSSIWNQQLIKIRRTSKINTFKDKQKTMKLYSNNTKIFIYRKQFTSDEVFSTVNNNHCITILIL